MPRDLPLSDDGFDVYSLLGCGLVHEQHLLLKSILDFLRCRLCELFRVVHVQSFPTTRLNIRMPDAI